MPVKQLQFGPRAAWRSSMVKKSPLARSLLPDLGENRLRKAEAGLTHFSDRVIENDEPGLIGLTENGEPARNLEIPSKCFLPPSLLIHKHDFGKHLGCEPDRLALIWSSYGRVRSRMGLKTSNHTGAL